MIFPSKSDRLLFYSTLPLVVGVVGLLLAIVSVTLALAWPSIERFGISLLLSSAWKPSDDPLAESYGLAPAVAGSLYVAMLATLISTPLSIALVLTVTEVLPRRLGTFLRYVAEVMGGLPTVIYGLWGSSVLVPLLRDTFMRPLHEYLGFIPLFSCEPVTGYSALAASIVLAIASTPYMAALLIEGYQMIPSKYREGAYSLGATKYEMLRIMLGILKPYMVAASLLGFSRTLGETTIVALTVGNSLKFTTCLLDPMYTIPSLIANQFESAGLYRYALPTLFTGALLLLFICLVASYLGIKLIYAWRGRVYV
jgi:phosphate transport system permease protein